nr:methyltransferase domain-containing protein [Ruegeria sp. Ofav3-42]
MKSEEEVYFADYFSQSESINRHQNNSAHNSSLIVEVDFILRDRALSEAVTIMPDLIIANHVLEHLPNPIHWLQDLEKIAASSAHLFLSLPDRSHTFDYFKPLSDAVDWLRCHDRAQEMPDKYQIIRQIYYHCDLNHARSWAGDLPDDHLYRMPMEDAISRAEDLARRYTDVHCSVFTCDSFCRIVGDLQHLIPWRVVHAEDTMPGENEFRVLMERTS